MLERPSNYASVCEGFDKDVENAESSTDRGRTEHDIGEDESLTKSRKTEAEQDIEKGKSSTESDESGIYVEKAESSTGRGRTDIEEDESFMNPRKTEAEQDIEKGESSTQCDDVEDSKVLRENGGISPKELSKRDGSCCIFRIPRGLASMHHKSQEPQIVSIGPYHHKKEHLQMMEEHKHGLQKLFLEKATQGVDITDLKGKIAANKDKIKNSYSEELDEETLVDMMLRDGCFVLMLFFFVSRKIEVPAGPWILILTTPWILPAIRSDLLLLENQVPFLLLKTLFEASSKSSLCSLNELVFKFFQYSIDKPDKYWENYKYHEAKHLLDLIRQTFIPISFSSGDSQSYRETSPSPQSFSRLIFSAKRLRLQGIKFKAAHESHAVSSPGEKAILDIQLKGNELQIPPIVFDSFISSVLLNCVTFEQLHADCGSDITNYVIFMGCLMSDESDATYLIEKGIIESYIGNGDDVSQFFKTIKNGIAYDPDKSRLKTVFEEINEYTSKTRNVEWARFKHLHFDSPWTCMSSSAVLAILLLTLLQAALAALAYFSSTGSTK